MESAYLQRTVGEVLAEVLKEVVEVRPADPIAFIATQMKVGQNSHESGRAYWATRSSVRSFARTVHSFAGSALLASLARSTALMSFLARSLIPELVGKSRIRFFRTTGFCPTVPMQKWQQNLQRRQEMLAEAEEVMRLMKEMRGPTPPDDGEGEDDEEVGEDPRDDEEDEKEEEEMA